MNTDKIPDDENAEQWLTKLAGKEVTKKIFEPLYARNKFNIPLSQISAKQFANRLKEKEISYNFSYPETGLQAMIDGLEKAIISKKEQKSNLRPV
jgi:protoporphyrinogen oxidase